MRKQQPSKFMNLNEIHQGYVREIADTSYFFIGDEAITRVNVFGCVIERREISPPDKRRFISLRIDDGTDTIGLTVWSYPKSEFGDPIKMVEDIVVGDIIEVIGRVREYNDELFISPKSVGKKDDGVMWEIYKRTQLLKQKMAEVSLGTEEVIDFSSSSQAPVDQ